MSSDDDRGWNIVRGEARPSWAARMMGASKEGEFPIVAWLLLVVAVGFTLQSLGVF